MAQPEIDLQLEAENASFVTAVDTAYAAIPPRMLPLSLIMVYIEQLAIAQLPKGDSLEGWLLYA